MKESPAEAILALGLLHRIFGTGGRAVRLLPVRHLALALLLIAGAAFGGVFAVANAQAVDGAISGLTLTSDSPGTLDVSWDAPNQTPTDYRVNWARADDDYPSWQSVEGNHHLEETSLELAGLHEGVKYKVRVRARYYRGDHVDEPWSGPWADATQAVADDAEDATPTPEPTPLTAQFQDMPEFHDGEERFRIRILFSEDIGISYETLRDHVLTVTGGDVVNAGRVDGRNDLWTVIIEPDSGYDVEISLPPTTDCASQGAICVGDGKRLSNAISALVPGPNTPATGALTISGAAQSGQTLRADTSGISDADGMKNATMEYQWLADDADIAGAANSAYVLTDADVGKVFTVRVSFTDDNGNQETLNSAPTAPVAAAEPDQTEAPGAPQSLTVATASSGQLALSWTTPDSDTGITGYKVQWKPSSGSWDTPGDVSETTVTGTSHTITGLTDGAEYSVRVRAVNSAGDGAAAESTGTPVGLTVEPTQLTAQFWYVPESHDGEEEIRIRILFSEDIGIGYETLRDYVLDVDGGEVVKAGRLDGRNDLWTVIIEPDGKGDVTIVLPATEDCAAPGAICVGSGRKKLSNRSETTIPGPGLVNSPATERPGVRGTAESGGTLTAVTSRIRDADGMQNAAFEYQWLAAAAAIQGATSSTYTLTDDEVGLPIRVRVSFTDDAGYDETLTSGATAAVTNDDMCPRGRIDTTPTAVSVDAVPIVVDSTTADYFVLFVKPDLDSASEIPVSVTLGQDGTTTLTDLLSALPKEHYRVEKFLISDPGDVDGDCIDDITELQEPVRMNPLNPSLAISLVDGAVRIPDRETFETLSYKGDEVVNDTHLTDLEFIKFYIVDPDFSRPRVYFMNTRTHRAHYLFRFAINLPSWGSMSGVIVYHPNVVAPDGSLGVYRYEFESTDAYSFKAVAKSYELLAASMPLLDNNLAYYPMPTRALGRVVKRVCSRSSLPGVGRRPSMMPPFWRNGSPPRATA